MNPSKKAISLAPVRGPSKLVRPDGFKTAAVAVTHEGDAIRLLVEEKDAASLVARTEQPGWASFPNTHTDKEYSAIVSISNGPGTREVRVPRLTASFVKIDTLPQGETLIVASRCYRAKNGTHELNAKVFDRDGNQCREFLLGDGIAHVQTDAKGNIWVAYFDEGVYGNFGWATDGNRLGVAGLSCFSRDGQKMWDFQPPDGFDNISDCYALNVAAAGAWAYYYQDFPIAFIDSDWQVHAWKTQTSGARAFAVGEKTILLFTRGGTCSLLRLLDGDTQLVADVSLVLPNEVDVTRAKVIGRGRELHLFSGDDWYVFSIDSLR